MPPIPTENKTMVLRNDSKKRQRPVVEEELVQENENETAKRVRTNETEGRLNAKRETVKKRQKGAKVSTSQAATRRSTRKTRSTKTDQLHHARTDGKQTILVPPQGFAGKADHISVTKVAEMVKKLNAEIEQISSLMTDSLSYRRLPGSGSECGMALNELHDYLGAQLCDELQRRSNQINMEPNPVLTQITLQTGLVNICSRIITLSDWDHPFWGKNSTSSRMEQVDTDTWRKQSHTNTTVSQHENQEFNEKYLTDVLLKFITAVGGSPQSEVTLPFQYNAKLQGIVQQAIELQNIVRNGVTSTGFAAYAIPCDAEFDPSKMEDVKSDITALLSRVACTVEMGLRCGKRIDSWSKVPVVVKPKVVLATTLEALCSMSLTKNVKQLEVNVAEMYQLLQNNAEKLSSIGMEANRWNEDHAKDIGRLEARIVAQDQVLQKNGIKGTTNERVHVLSEAQGIEKRQAATGLRNISLEGEYTHKPSASVRKPDSISVTEVAELVRILNAQIEQVSVLVADSLSYNETPSSGEEVRIVLDELDDYVGQWLYSNLWSRSERKMEPDPLITQITIQTGLVHLCCGIVNGFLIGGYSDAAGASRGFTDALRARAHSNMAFSQSECKEAVRKDLMELLLKLITAVGGSQETLQPQYSEKVEDITMKAIELRKVISQDVTSVELSTYTIPYDTRFDPSQMEDTEGEGNTTVPVVCTLEMGLLCRKKVAHAKQSGYGGERQDVSMKAKVVLATTLETVFPE